MIKPENCCMKKTLILILTITFFSSPAYAKCRECKDIIKKLEAQIETLRKYKTEPEIGDIWEDYRGRQFLLIQIGEDRGWLNFENYFKVGLDSYRIVSSVAFVDIPFDAKNYKYIGNFWDVYQKRDVLLNIKVEKQEKENGTI